MIWQSNFDRHVIRIFITYAEPHRPEYSACVLLLCCQWPRMECVVNVLQRTHAVFPSCGRFCVQCIIFVDSAFGVVREKRIQSTPSAKCPRNVILLSIKIIECVGKTHPTSLQFGNWCVLLFSQWSWRLNPPAVVKPLTNSKERK